ncbi:MAG TPA: hypothetical protein VLH35_07045 [Candidatus Acidoferrales bacterium]|nr:hypothetical protein [Candidatus Acidoferrales bacterium]
MKYPEFWTSASPKQKRIYSTVFVLMLSVLATVAGTMVPLGQEEAQLIYNQLNQTSSSPTLLTDIFVNNFPLCLLMFIPLAGIGIGLFILFSTGMAFRAVFDVQAAQGFSDTATASSIDPTTAILVLVLAGAVFVLEYISYSIAMSESVWLFRRLTQKRWKELKVLALLIGVVAALLAIGAVVEWVALSIGI